MKPKVFVMVVLICCTAAIAFFEEAASHGDLYVEIGSIKLLKGSGPKNNQFG